MLARKMQLLKKDFMGVSDNRVVETPLKREFVPLVLSGESGLKKGLANCPTEEFQWDWIVDQVFCSLLLQSKLCLWRSSGVVLASPYRL